MKVQKKKKGGRKKTSWKKKGVKPSKVLIMCSWTTFSTRAVIVMAKRWLYFPPRPAALSSPSSPLPGDIFNCCLLKRKNRNSYKVHFCAAVWDCRKFARKCDVGLFNFWSIAMAGCAQDDGGYFNLTSGLRSWIMCNPDEQGWRNWLLRCIVRGGNRVWRHVWRTWSKKFMEMSIFARYKGKKWRNPIFWCLDLGPQNSVFFFLRKWGELANGAAAILETPHCWLSLRVWFTKSPNPQPRKTIQN